MKFDSKSKCNKMNAKKVEGNWESKATPIDVRIKPMPSNRLHEKCVIVVFI
jgi:hypothetical protein